MKSQRHYLEGQRWEFSPAVDGFETTFVIGGVGEAQPEFGWNERKYDVYVQYNAAARTLIPADWDGVVLSLTDEGMDRSVTKLVASNVDLPWWWVYGRRIRSKEDEPNSSGVLMCDTVSDGLEPRFEEAKQTAVALRMQWESLRKHHEKFDSRMNLKPSSSIAESWQRIESWYAENAYSLDNALGPGASTVKIEEFQDAIGMKLPEDFIESVQIHDGGGWSVPWRYGELLSLNEILEQWRLYSDSQARGKYATEDWKAEQIKGQIKPVFWNKKRIYVSDNSGEHLTLDLDAPEDGTYGQIIDHSHEVGPMDVVASGWGEFLRNLVADLESGKYLYVEFTRSVELVEDLERNQR